MVVLGGGNDDVHVDVGQQLQIAVVHRACYLADVAGTELENSGWERG